MNWIWIFLFAAFHSFANVQCPARALERKDCWLKLKDFRVQISQKKITWNDMVWTSITDSPYVEDKNTWDKISLEKLGDHYLLQMWIWMDGKNQDPLTVQSLRWVVFELKQKEFVKGIDEIVRKRKYKANHKYSYDRWMPHSINLKKRDLVWSVGKKKSSFEKVSTASESFPTPKKEEAHGV